MSLQVRPDHVLLRVVARAMVMWDSVLPTRAWLLEQLPPLIQVRTPQDTPGQSSSDLCA